MSAHPIFSAYLKAQGIDDLLRPCRQRVESIDTIIRQQKEVPPFKIDVHVGQCNYQRNHPMSNTTDETVGTGSKIRRHGDNGKRGGSKKHRVGDVHIKPTDIKSMDTGNLMSSNVKRNIDDVPLSLLKSDPGLANGSRSLSIVKKETSHHRDKTTLTAESAYSSFENSQKKTEIKEPLVAGDRVYAAWLDEDVVEQDWYPGAVKSFKVVGRSEYGEIKSYCIHFEDGDTDDSVPETHVWSEDHYLLHTKMDKRTLKGVRCCYDLNSNDQYAVKRGWFETTLSGDCRFPTLREAMETHDKLYVRKAGKTANPQNFNFPDAWVFSPGCVPQKPVPNPKSSYTTKKNKRKSGATHDFRAGNISSVKKQTKRNEESQPHQSSGQSTNSCEDVSVHQGKGKELKSPAHGLKTEDRLDGLTSLSIKNEQNDFNMIRELAWHVTFELMCDNTEIDVNNLLHGSTVSLRKYLHLWKQENSSQNFFKLSSFLKSEQKMELYNHCENSMHKVIESHTSNGNTDKSLKLILSSLHELELEIGWLLEESKYDTEDNLYDWKYVRASASDKLAKRIDTTKELAKKLTTGYEDAQLYVYEVNRDNFTSYCEIVAQYFKMVSLQKESSTSRIKKET